MSVSAPIAHAPFTMAAQLTDTNANQPRGFIAALPLALFGATASLGNERAERVRRGESGRIQAQSSFLSVYNGWSCEIRARE